LRHAFPPRDLEETMSKPPKNKNVLHAYGFAWVTAAFFIISLAGHWLFGWFAFVDEQRDHGQVAEFSAYAVEITRDTLENWQSEFLQLLWQVAGLGLLYYFGSPQSKEGDDRKEAKIDAILRHVDPDNADAIIARIDRQYTHK
jgi:hypothetical protein